jgi:hypothetical protein
VKDEVYFWILVALTIVATGALMFQLTTAK